MKTHLFYFITYLSRHDPKFYVSLILHPSTFSMNVHPSWTRNKVSNFWKTTFILTWLFQFCSCYKIVASNGHMLSNISNILYNTIICISARDCAVYIYLQNYNYKCRYIWKLTFTPTKSAAFSVNNNKEAKVSLQICTSQTHDKAVSHPLEEWW